MYINKWTTCHKCSLYATNPRCRTVPFNGTTPRLFIVSYKSTFYDYDGMMQQGEEGELLRAMLDSIGVTSRQVYITTLVKCNDATDKKAVENCNPFILEELRQVNPKAVLLLGSAVGKSVFGSGYSITKDRGIIDFLGHKGVITYSPQYLLRFPSLSVGSKKWDTWTDLKLLMGMLETAL